MRQLVRVAALGWASVIAVFGNGWIVSEARASVAAPVAAEGRLEQAINRAIRAGGPFFTAGERTVIERKCGYGPGQWDGYDVNVSNGVFHCTNGRKVDDAEMRALLKVAEPRIAERVGAIMADAEVQGAIAALTQEATAQALREVADQLGKRR
jgi:hypothetical protein